MTLFKTLTTGVATLALSAGAALADPALIFDLGGNQVNTSARYGISIISGEPAELGRDLEPLPIRNIAFEARFRTFDTNERLSESGLQITSLPINIRYIKIMPSPENKY